MAQTASNSSGLPPGGSRNSDNGRSISVSEAGQAIANESTTSVSYSSSKAIFAESGENGSQIAAYKKPAKEDYVTVIKLANITIPSGPNDSQSRFSSKILIGLNNPSYGFKNVLSVTGNFDFKIESVILGMSNAAKMTIAYDIRRSLKSNNTYFEMSVSKVAFQVEIPFGK